MRTKVDFRTGSKATYNKFCSDNPEINITFEEWGSIIYMYSTLVRDYILETGKMFALPKGIGEFTINKRKKKKIIEKDGKQYINLPVDWKKTKERGKKVYIMNFHTEGYSYSWKWIKRGSRVKFSYMWSFRVTREASRLLGSLLQSGKGYHNRYCEWFK